MDNLIQEVKFKRKAEDVSADVITCKVNEDERRILDEVKKLIRQDKDSTALKQMAWVGAKVLQESKTSFIISLLFENKRKNKRMGIKDLD